MRSDFSLNSVCMYRPDDVYIMLQLLPDDCRRNMGVSVMNDPTYSLLDVNHI